VNLNRKWGFIDKTGKEVIPLKYYSISNYSEGLALVSVTVADKQPGHSVPDVVKISGDLGVVSGSFPIR